MGMHMSQLKNYILLDDHSGIKFHSPTGAQLDKREKVAVNFFSEKLIRNFSKNADC